MSAEQQKGDQHHGDGGTGGPFPRSMDGGKSYQNPSRCTYSVVTQTPAMVDVSCKHTYASGDPHATDIDIHYVLRQGNTGLYALSLIHICHRL